MNPGTSNSAINGNNTVATSSSRNSTQQNERSVKFLPGIFYGLVSRTQQFFGVRTKNVDRVCVTESRNTGEHCIAWNRTEQQAFVTIIRDKNLLETRQIPFHDCQLKYRCELHSNYEFLVRAGPDGRVKSIGLSTGPSENLNWELSERNGRIEISCPEINKTEFSADIKIDKKLKKSLRGLHAIEYTLAEQVKPRQVVNVTLFARSNVTSGRRKFVKSLTFEGKLDAAYQIYYQGTKVLVIFVVEGRNTEHELTEMCNKYTPVYELPHHVTLAPRGELDHKIICKYSKKETKIEPEVGAAVKYDELFKRGHLETCFSICCPEGKTEAQLVHVIGEDESSFMMSVSDNQEDILDVTYHIYKDSIEKAVSVCFFLEGKAPDYENKPKETDGCKLVGGQLTGTKHVQLTPGQKIVSKLVCKDSSLVLEPKEGEEVSYDALYERKHSEHRFLVLPSEQKEMEVALCHTLGDSKKDWFKMTLGKWDGFYKACDGFRNADDDPQECFDNSSVPKNGNNVTRDSFCNSLKDEPPLENQDQVRMAIKLMKKANEVMAICYHPDSHKVDSTVKTLAAEGHFTNVSPVPMIFRLDNPPVDLLLQAHANGRGHVDIRPASHNVDIKLAMGSPITFSFSCTSDQENDVPVEFRVMKNQDIVAQHPFEVRCYGKDKEGKATSATFMTTNGPVSMQMQQPNISVAPNQNLTGNQNTRTNERGENGNLHMSVGKETKTSDQVDGPSTSGLQTQQTPDANVTPRPRCRTKREYESSL